LPGAAHQPWLVTINQNQIRVYGTISSIEGIGIQPAHITQRPVSLHEGGQ
jgi:hypothetical protein